MSEVRWLLEWARLCLQCRLFTEAGEAENKLGHIDPRTAARRPRTKPYTTILLARISITLRIKPVFISISSFSSDNPRDHSQITLRSVFISKSSFSSDNPRGHSQITLRSREEGGSGRCVCDRGGISRYYVTFHKLYVNI